MKKSNAPLIRGKEAKKKHLLKVVGQILGSEGFKGLGVNKVAQKAGVDKVLIYRYFGGLPELVLAFSHTVDFWPSLDELLGPEPEKLNDLGADEQMAFFFKSFLRALRRRPMTMNILQWRESENNELATRLDDIRMRSALEFFERLENIPDERDLTGIVVIIYSAISSLIIRSQKQSFFGGIDLATEDGWKRIDDAIDLLLHGTFTS